MEVERSRLGDVELLLRGGGVVHAHELHEIAVDTQRGAQVNLFGGEEGVPLCQDEVGGGVDALGEARGEQ